MGRDDLAQRTPDAEIRGWMHGMWTRCWPNIRQVLPKSATGDSYTNGPHSTPVLWAGLTRFFISLRSDGWYRHL